MTLFDALLESEKGVPDADFELIAIARSRHRLTPFFLVLENEPYFGVLVLWPEHSYRETGKGISLPDAVMCLDVGALLRRGSALA